MAEQTQLEPVKLISCEGKLHLLPWMVGCGGLDRSKDIQEADFPDGYFQ